MQRCLGEENIADQLFGYLTVDLCTGLEILLQTLEKLLHNELCPTEEIDREKNPVLWLKQKIMTSAKEMDGYDEK